MRGSDPGCPAKSQIKFLIALTGLRGSIRVVGESMEPTLPDGGSILVDRNRRRRRVGRIFVVRTGRRPDRQAPRQEHGRRLAAHQRPPGQAGLPTRPWPHGTEVIGEVKWAARTFE